MFLDVGFDGQKILVDEGLGLLVFIRLGIQPSTGASCGSCAEVQQNGSILLLGCHKRLINVLAPTYGHIRFLPPGQLETLTPRNARDDSMLRLHQFQDHLTVGFVRLHQLLRLFRLVRRNGLQRSRAQYVFVDYDG